MDRSSHQSLRPERIANSPYRRPVANGMKKSSSFASIRSILSYPLNLFRNPSQELSLPTTTSDLPVQVEANSESGSEDEWNGQPPTSADGMDVFDAAASAGRTGPEFEARTAQWRAKGEVPGGRRDLARRSLEVGRCSSARGSSDSNNREYPPTHLAPSVLLPPSLAQKPPLLCPSL